MSIKIYEPGDRLTFNPERPDIKMTISDYQIFIYPKSGLFYVRYLYDDMLDALTEDLRRNSAEHYDNLIVITGKEGRGKSNLGMALAKKIDPLFDVRKGYIYDFPEFLGAISRGDDRGRVFLLDEGANIASNRDWMRDDNKAFIKFLEMLRSRQYYLIICVPKLERIDLYIRESRARYILNCESCSWHGQPIKRRGYFQCRRVIAPESGGGDTVYPAIGYGSFPEMQGADKMLYEKIKSESQIRTIQREEEKRKRKEDPYGTARENRALLLELSRSGKSIQELADMTGKSYGTIANRLTKAKKEAGDNANP